LGGVIQTPVVPPRPTLVIRINGTLRNIGQVTSHQSADHTGQNLDADDDAMDTTHESQDVALKNLIEDHNESDEEDSPDFLFDEGEVKSPDPNYVFCPSEHRLGILHLLFKHFVQHPIFPIQNDDGSTSIRTAQEIRDAAVYEMYQHCHQRNLREVWGYLWQSWYQPKMWKLWSQSTSAFLSQL